MVLLTEMNHGGSLRPYLGNCAKKAFQGRPDLQGRVANGEPQNEKHRDRKKGGRGRGTMVRPPLPKPWDQDVVDGLPYPAEPSSSSSAGRFRCVGHPLDGAGTLAPARRHLHGRAPASARLIPRFRPYPSLEFAYDALLRPVRAKARVYLPDDEKQPASAPAVTLGLPKPGPNKTTKFTSHARGSDTYVLPA